MKTTNTDDLRGMALLRSEVGASLVEYSMLIAMIAIVTVISITAVGSATARNRHYARRDWVRITGWVCRSAMM